MNTIAQAFDAFVSASCSLELLAFSASNVPYDQRDEYLTCMKAAREEIVQASSQLLVLLETDMEALRECATNS